MDYTQQNIEQALQKCDNLGDILVWLEGEFDAAQLYFGHGTDNAWDEAVMLAAHVMQLPVDVGREALSLTLDAQQCQRLAELAEQRLKQRMPAAYLIHEAWFAGMPFYVDQRVLIPRSPLAELIMQGFTPWVEPDKVTNILDLCTGSACIAIACAKAFPDANVVASDISSDALAVATMNVERYVLQEQVQLVKSDVFAEIQPQAFDVIVSNPPYVDARDMADLPQEYHFEPRQGLAAGETGLDIVDTILAQARDYLAPHGILIVEVGNSQDALIERYPNLPFMWLAFASGGDGVFLLTAQQLVQANL